ncbi:hypothetical protein EVAR_20181_1 [Eumeta japonica]|uniref:Uncharacterized protein n=1 Tax=Eumeta variegata TaxID=151549 RepID=A0A4C1UV37_EUMVA|nr:hypothetical protein EVAR_20181_1 [Eumeta japonica]
MFRGRATPWGGARVPPRYCAVGLCDAATNSRSLTHPKRITVPKTVTRNVADGRPLIATIRNARGPGRRSQCIKSSIVRAGADNGVTHALRQCAPAEVAYGRIIVVVGARARVPGDGNGHANGVASVDRPRRQESAVDV